MRYFASRLWIVPLVVITLIAIIIAIPIILIIELAAGMLSGADEGSIIKTAENRKLQDRHSLPELTNDQDPNPKSQWIGDHATLKPLISGQMGHFSNREFVANGIIHFGRCRDGGRA